jgi:protein SCO1
MSKHGWYLTGMILLLAGALSAQTTARLERELEGVEVVERFGETIPLDLPFMDDDGRNVTLGQYFREGRPVLITLNYADCPRMCSMQLSELARGMKDIDWTPGEEFMVLTISIDPNEEPDRAKLSKVRYLSALGNPNADTGWRFLVNVGGTEENVRTLAEALGYGYRYDPGTGEYIHKSAAFIVTGDGVISHYLRNLNYEPRFLQAQLEQSAAGELGEPDASGLGFGINCMTLEYTDNIARAFMFMRIGGVGILVFLFSFVGYWWLRELKRPRAGQSSGEGSAAGTGGPVESAT